MMKCPQCGASNPDESRNCRECYHPFGLERALRETMPSGDMPPPQPHVPRVPMGPAGPYPERPMQALPVKPLRKTPLGAWIALAVLIIGTVFAAAWYFSRSSGGSYHYLKTVFNNMESLRGWKADARVDSSGFTLSQLSFELGDTWQGELVYEAPGRFSLSARSSGENQPYALRIIDDRFYELESLTGHWKDLGSASHEQKSMNPLWDDTLLKELSLKEEEGLEEVDYHTCKVFSFDQEVTVKEESLFTEDEETTYRYAGKFYIETGSDLLISMDYVVELSGMGRSHYVYDFNSLGDPTTVDLPPNIESSSGG